ncbi:MAG TPA: SnoaL-like domain-containing protein [Puia sp.]
MTTEQIALRLKELCDQGQFEHALKELFSSDALSIEPRESPDFAMETKGIDAILAKGKKWNEMVVEKHGFEISDPLIAQDSFALTMQIDVTIKDRGRMNHKELCVYKVSGGRIVSEQFFM